MSTTSEQNFPYQGSGQITMDSPFGKLVYAICRNSRVRNVVEVGTWNGQGTTVCIMNALVGKESVVYSIESDRNRYNEAVSFWSHYETHGKLHLMYGVLHRNPIPDFRILGIVEGDDMFVHHYAPEKRMVEDTSVPLLTLEGIRDIDCVVLDGGEYTTDGDFSVLMKFNPKVIILDDTAIYKCRRIRAALLEEDRYEARYDNPSDRNGAAIFVLKGAQGE